MAAHQAPLSMGFSRQKYWSGVPLPSPIKPCSHTLFLNLSFISKNLCYLFAVVILGPLITPIMELSLMYSFYNLVFLKSDFFQCLKSFLETTQVWSPIFSFNSYSSAKSWMTIHFCYFSQHEMCRIQSQWLFASLCIVAFLTTHGDLYSTSISWKLCP